MSSRNHNKAKLKGESTTTIANRMLTSLNHENETQTVSKKVQSLEEQNRTFEKQITCMSSEIKMLNDDVEIEKAISEANVNQLFKDVREIKAGLADANSKNDELVNANRGLEERVTYLFTVVEKLQADFADTQSQLLNANAENDELVYTNRSLEKLVEECFKMIRLPIPAV